MSVLCQIKDSVDVDGIAQRLAHPLIIKRCFSVVQIERLDEVHFPFDHIIAVGQAVHLVERHVERHVERPRVERCEERICVLIDPAGHLFQVRRAAVVVLIPHEDNLVLW